MSCKKKNCECSGSFNDPIFKLTANICPNCILENSFVRSTTFNSTSVNPPSCFTTAEGIHLATTGTGVDLIGGQQSPGAFGLIMSQLPGAFNRVVFSFITFAPATQPLASMTVLAPPAGALSISPCNLKDCGCSSNAAPNPLSNQFSNLVNFANGSNRLDEIVTGKFIIQSNGQIERVEQ